MIEIPLGRDPLGREAFAIADDEDGPLIDCFEWRVTGSSSKTFYAITRGQWRSGRGVLLMHRLLTNDPEGIPVDHRNGNGLDNRRDNLRLATPCLNSGNQRLRPGGTSRYKGVSWSSQRHRWAAYIQGGGRRRGLGRFASEVEAAKAYDAAARELYGEFAALNFPGPGERAA